MMQRIVLENVLLSIITNISFNHIDRLGNDLKSITYHKAGIIKPNTFIVTSELNSEKDIFFEELKNNNSHVSYLKFVNPKKLESYSIELTETPKRKYVNNDEKSIFYNQEFKLNTYCKLSKRKY